MELSYIPPVAPAPTPAPTASPAASTAAAAQQSGDAVSTAVLKKSLDAEASTAAGILQSVPPAPSVNPNIGSIVNTTA